jgi:hypothetical protein
MKPSQHSDAVGTPACSATALARNTAGVQLPQQPMPETIASTLRSAITFGMLAST